MVCISKNSSLPLDPALLIPEFFITLNGLIISSDLIIKLSNQKLFVYEVDPNPNPNLKN